MVLDKRNRNSAFCMESHSLRAGCIVCDARNGPTKMVLKLKDLLITLYVTSASALCEFVLIVTINEIASFCPGLPVVIEKSTKRLHFVFLLIRDTLFASLLVIMSFVNIIVLFSLINTSFA